MRLAIDLANTTHARLGEVRDELQTPADLAGWLARVGSHCAVPADDESLSSVDLADLAAARGLRAAIRAVACAVATGRAPDPADLENLNSAVRAAPHWQELAFDGTVPRVTGRHGARAVPGVLAEVAADAVGLLADGRIGACAAPGCVLLFVRDRPNREWCSNACGNRARVARHHDRHRQPAPDHDASA